MCIETNLRQRDAIAKTRGIYRYTCAVTSNRQTWIYDEISLAADTDTRTHGWSHELTRQVALCCQEQHTFFVCIVVQRCICTVQCNSCVRHQLNENSCPSISIIDRFVQNMEAKSSVLYFRQFVTGIFCLCLSIHKFQHHIQNLIGINIYVKK